MSLLWRLRCSDRTLSSDHVTGKTLDGAGGSVADRFAVGNCRTLLADTTAGNKSQAVKAKQVEVNLPVVGIIEQRNTLGSVIAKASPAGIVALRV